MKERKKWDLQSFNDEYKNVGYYESSYEWREKKGIPRAIVDYDYPRVKGRLLDWMEKNNGGIILDVGAGVGYFIFEMIKKSPNTETQFVGLDVSKEHLKWLVYRRKKENRGNIFAVVGDAMHLPFKDSIYDIITCTEVLEHITDPEKVISEINMALKMGGRALFSTPSKPAWTFWSMLFYFPRLLMNKKILMPYDNPLHPNQFIEYLRSNKLDIRKFEMNVILPPQPLFSRKLPAHIPKVMVSVILKVCNILEVKWNRLFRGLALHMLLEAWKS